jgi:hypothetical protein
MPIRKAIIRPINEKEAVQLHEEMKAQSQALDAFMEDSQAKLKKLLANKIQVKERPSSPNL